MAVHVLQTLGLEAAAINTVNFSNHTGYKQFTGTRTPPEEIRSLYEGLKQSYLTDFQVLLSGYIPSAPALHEVALIARDLRFRTATKPGGFFWALDPVMGDQGRLYVSEELVNGYKTAVREADLILPNQFELQVLTGVEIGTEREGARLDQVSKAIDVVHRELQVKHVVVTSVRVQGKEGVLCVVGSSSQTDSSSRVFVIDVPVLECFFSGTGDMFAALMVGRLRQECSRAGVSETVSWASPDDVPATGLPLAAATCKVLSSMQMVLETTMRERDEEIERSRQGWGSKAGGIEGQGHDDDAGKREYLLKTKAAEVRVVRNARDIVQPEDRYHATALDM